MIMLALSRPFTVLFFFGLVAQPCLARAADTAGKMSLVDFRKVALATTHKITIHVTDDVKHGCLPNPKVLQNAAEIEFRTRGFKVIDKELAPVDYIISATGFSLGGNSGLESGCVIALNVSARYIFATNLIPYGKGPNNERYIPFYYTIFQNLQLMKGSYSFTQKRMRETVTQTTVNYILSILKAREVIFKKRPDIKLKFEKSKKN